MKQLKPLMLAAAVSMTLVACSSEKMADAVRTVADRLDGGEEAQNVAEMDATPVKSEPQTQVQAPGFDINSVPLSTAALGDFPYITLPSGYSNKQYSSKTLNFARFPFWTGGQSQWVEGKFYLTKFSSEKRGEFSQYEVQRNLEAMITQMGGVKVAEGKIPREEINAWGDEITRGFIAGLGDIYNDAVSTYVVRRDDGNIWFHMVINSAAGALVVGKEEGFKQTAKLLPASELKRQIDATGKVALQVNFAVDKTDILPESQPQIAQVLELLRQDDTLKLGVHGHTDNTGSSEHNQTLSDGRARAVVAALTSQGIAAERLSAKGFGDTQPVADNSTEQGRAQNRRVELVKQ